MPWPDNYHTFQYSKDQTSRKQQRIELKKTRRLSGAATAPRSTPATQTPPQNATHTKAATQAAPAADGKTLLLPPEYIKSACNIARLCLLMTALLACLTVMELFPLQSKALPWMPIPLSMIKVVLAYLIVMLSWWDVAKLWVGLVYLYPKTRYVPVPLELQDQAARAQAVAAKHAAASAKGVLQQLNDWAGSSGWVAHFMVMSVLFLAWLCAHHFNRTDGDTYTQELLVRHRTGRGLAAEAVSDKDILDDIDWWVYWLSRVVVFAPFMYMSFLAEEMSKLVEAGILWDVVVDTPALVRAVVLHPLSSIALQTFLDS